MLYKTVCIILGINILVHIFGIWIVLLHIICALIGTYICEIIIIYCMEKEKEIVVHKKDDIGVSVGSPFTVFGG